MIKYLLIDCDGVLHDNDERLVRQAKAVQGFLGQSVEEIIRSYFSVHQYIHDNEMHNHNNQERHFILLSQKFGLEISDQDAGNLAAAWQKAYDGYYLNPKKYDDVYPFLSAIAEIGLKVCLVSGSTREERRRLLEAMGFDSFFLDIFAANTIGYQKQDIRFYQEVLSQLGAKPEETAVLGDQYNDDISAGQLGLKTILLKRPGKEIKDDGKYQPEKIISNLAEALPILKLWMEK